MFNEGAFDNLFCDNKRFCVLNGDSAYDNYFYNVNIILYNFYKDNETSKTPTTNLLEKKKTRFATYADVFISNEDSFELILKDAFNCVNNKISIKTYGQYHIEKYIPKKKDVLAEYTITEHCYLTGSTYYKLNIYINVHK